ncbi:hypothetical protein BH09BAC5_BH09BAC5_25520 [soil metagenome]
MSFALTRSYSESVQSGLLDFLNDLNLTCFASEAAHEMEFESMEEFHYAIKRAIEICVYSGISVEANFRQVYICTDTGISYDWKLSLLGYRLVCLNGYCYNKNVAKLQMELINSNLNSDSFCIFK